MEKKKNVLFFFLSAKAAARRQTTLTFCFLYKNNLYMFVQKFRQEFGHTIVPNKNKKYASLHNWLRKTKEKWRKQVVTQEPHVCPLTREQIQKLIDVGAGTAADGPTNFADQAIATDWHVRFAELVTFKNQNGHTNVSDFKHKDTHYRLAVWVRFTTTVHARCCFNNTTR